MYAFFAIDRNVVQSRTFPSHHMHKVLYLYPTRSMLLLMLSNNVNGGLRDMRKTNRGFYIIEHSLSCFTADRDTRSFFIFAPPFLSSSSRSRAFGKFCAEKKTSKRRRVL